MALGTRNVWLDTSQHVTILSFVTWDGVIHVGDGHEEQWFNTMIKFVDMYEGLPEGSRGGESMMTLYDQIESISNILFNVSETTYT